MEGKFITLAIKGHGTDLAETSAFQTENLFRNSVLALRSNISRHLKGMDHREFYPRLADSPLPGWFLQIGRVDKVKVFAKSTSDCFSRWINEDGILEINNRLIALLGLGESEVASNRISFVELSYSVSSSTAMGSPILLDGSRFPRLTAQRPTEKLGKTLEMLRNI